MRESPEILPPAPGRLTEITARGTKSGIKNKPIKNKCANYKSKWVARSRQISINLTCQFPAKCAFPRNAKYYKTICKGIPAEHG
jgi:hypothetical protein